MEFSVVLALLSLAVSLPILIELRPSDARPYYDGPVRRPLTTERRERCRCGQCEQCDPLYQSYGR